MAASLYYSRPSTLAEVTPESLSVSSNADTILSNKAVTFEGGYYILLKISCPPLTLFAIAIGYSLPSV
jgi:hypothetical protein